MAESVPEATAEEQLAREMRAQLAAVTGGLAPDDYAQAWWGWYLRVAQTPGKPSAIAKTAYDALLDNFNFGMRAATGQPVAPSAEDKRFASPAWNQWPFNVMA